MRYVVSWQNPGENTNDIPGELSGRDDVGIFPFYEKGLGANRNNALCHCGSDIVLTADDDLRYTAGDLKNVMAFFENNPDVDVATFRYRGEQGGKTYPDTECDLGFPLPKDYSVSSIEIAFRRSIAGTVKFDPRFGLGAKTWQAGEDEKFLIDARRKGFRCRFFPIDITTHNGPSTGDIVITSPGVAAASGRIIREEYPQSWIPRIVLKGWRQWRRGGRFFFLMYHLLRGAFSNGL